MQKLHSILRKEDTSYSHFFFKKDFIQELKYMYWSEKQLVKFLYRAEKKASSRYLKASFKGHAVATLQHVIRLERIFELVGVSPISRMFYEMDGLLNEALKSIKATEKNTFSRDKCLLAISQKIERLEAKKYNSLISKGNELGELNLIFLLEETLMEELEAEEAFGAVLEDTLMDEKFRIEAHKSLEEEEFEALEAV